MMDVGEIMDGAIAQVGEAVSDASPQALVMGGSFLAMVICWRLARRMIWKS